MESFLRRMSSIVRKGSNKSSDARDNDDEQHQEHFQYLQQRRRSAPDIRRRNNQVEKTSMELDQKVTSVEEIHSRTSILSTNTSNFIRKQHQSISKLPFSFFVPFLKILPMKKYRKAREIKT